MVHKSAVDGYDVIIVGGGHHGLTCGAYLARAGRKVVVLEREQWLGGMTYSRETVAEAPGFTMNPCAVDLLFTQMRPSIIDDLRLESFGLRQISPEPWGAYLGPDGESIGLWRSLDRTVAEIRRYSRRDAQKFAELCGLWCDFWYTAAPYLMDHPTRPWPRTVAELVWRAARKRRMWALMPSAADRSQVPAGSDGDTMYLFCTSVPHELSDGRAWADHRDAFARQAFSTFDRYAPGMQDAVLGYWVKGPEELTHMSAGGSYVVVDMSMNQMGPYRPTPSLAGYRTPISGLWHTGGGAHPIGGVHGWAGRTTARWVDRTLRRNGRRNGAT